MPGPDQNIEGLMTEKSLSLHDGAAVAAAAAAAGVNKVADATLSEQLPSYHDAVDAPTSIDTSANTVARPTGQQQLDLIRPMKNRPLVAGDTWYLVSRTWYRRWNTACSELRDSDPAEKVDVAIGPIDNSDLLHEDSNPSFARLRQGISEGMEYEMLPEEGWKHLVDWYGSTGPLFARTVIEGLSPGQESVEFYPPIIRLLKLESDVTVSGPGPVSFSLSVSASLAELKLKAKELLKLGAVTDVDIRFYHYPEPIAGEFDIGLVHISRVEEEGVDVIDAKEDEPDSYQPNVTLKAVGVEEIEVCLAVETRQSGRWQTDPAPAAPSMKGIFAQQGDFFSNLQQNAASPSTNAAQSAAGEAQGRVTRSQTAIDRTMGRSRGLRGLNNLGNTCFMNSALQCLSNTYELQQYFVSGAYKEELNTDNPLGMGGAIADAFGSLITNIWNGQGGSFWPREFKYALSRFAPQFSGYAQHDSQELLAFLLDGLHEDLNRILKKPYIEAPDWEGGDEKDLVAFAKRQWDIYKARNDSVIVDLFQGQYRSTLVCPVCSKVSIKFDPFMYLTLPIPNKKMWRGQVYFVPSDASKRMRKFQVQLPAGSTVSKLRQKVAAQFGVETKRLVCGEVWHHRIYKWIDDYEPLVDIKEGDFVYFWEVPAAPRFSKQRHYRYHRTIEDAEDALDIPDEEQAILPVFANFASDAFGASSSQAFVSRRARSDAVGIPFFISVPKSEVNDVGAIRKRVVEGFTRFTSQSSDLSKAVEEADVASTAAAGQQPTSHISDWEMVDDAATNNDAVEIVAPSRTDDSDVVTEIREDGETVVVPDITTSSSSGTETPAIVSSNTSLEEPKATTHAQAQPVLRIRFSVAEAGQGLPKGSESNADNLSEDLEERHSRLAQRQTKASRSSDQMSMTEDDDDDEAKDAAPAKVIPLVYTGGAIVVTWSQSIKERGLLVESDSAQLWGEYEEVVDEAIRERDSAGPARPKMLSIEDCMDEFTKEEQLGEDDPWYCPTCKEFRQATKKFDLWKAPDILVVHLKRFSAGRHSRDKLNMLVDFPLEGLDLTERVEGTQALRRVQEEAKESGEELSESMLGSGILRPLEDNDDAVAVDRPIYDLYAVDNHFGGLGGGHYTAFAKSPSDGKWYEFDDSSVRPVANPETVKSSSAYLLFYRRRTTRPIGGKSRQKFQEAAKTKATAAEQEGDVDVVAPDTQRNVTGEDSSDSSSDHTPDWSMNMRSGADDSMAEPAAGWSSLGNSPASSNRAPSPISDTGLDSP
ncbi:Peptidase C19, ubiquitin-specific peptidase, DUSP domain protein [Kalmanozyma brasiliensis GHG001]|uniref:ubiquitinyl hydrolase 1 n=1 Tax=Kalmanozyma brasiliensis (strain GHG001) TaxID=1365824 RepID=V5EYX2_KALBG|nr:Peptidase C19, ubiquitin-specific peptidase, DUSP domain protein [Kalmanozyma brasiliensis GHG001]EST09018.1 Peptidase C19, ubiquitin-specific peptidase, DUSP domain protein [Kalmanozyma brasiliensis GHG001]